MIKKTVIIIIGVLIVAAACAAAIILPKKFNKDVPESKTSVTTEEQKPEFSLSGDLTVSDIFTYSGEYVEDGSDENVENIAAVTLTNTGKTDYQYIEFTLKTADGEYAFAASSVHAGSVTTVLDRNKTVAGKETAVTEGECALKGEYEQAPGGYDDKFAVYLDNGTMNIKNISGADMPGTITVYYKNADENGFFGGITYRATIKGLKADEIQQRYSRHLGAVVNITYEE
ncbi:MAG: hypothetical protein IJ050_00925 [Clostridia bacterium]|nr:hypothetical protein [Clostridia bacterium]